MTKKRMQQSGGPRALQRLRKVSWRATCVAMMVAAGAVVGAMSGSVKAQVLAQNGQVLDANNQVGSGGSNAPVPGYVPFNQNIYQSQANGSLPANSQQYQVVPVTVPGGGVSYVRIPAVPTPLQVQAQNALPSLAGLGAYQPVSGGPDMRINGAINPNNYTSTQLYNINTGGSNGYNAAPLTRYAAVAAQSGVANPFININSSIGAANAAVNYSAPQTSDQTTSASRNQITVTGQVNPLFGLRTINGASAGAVPGSSNKPLQASGSNSGSLEPARPETSESNGQGGNGSAAISALVKPGGQQANKPMQGQVKPQNQAQFATAGDVYATLLNELRTGKKVNIVAPGIGGKPAMVLTNLAPQSPEQANKLLIDPITGLPIAVAQNSTFVQIVPRKAPAKAVSPTPANAAGGAGVQSPGTISVPSLHLPGQKARQQAQLNKVLQAGRALAALDSLAGPGPDQFNRFMRQGQQLTRQGKFMEALGAYQQAMITRSNNPLAMVGLAHAELGAGLYDSAAFNLQQVIAHHPELAAVRYNLARLMPVSTLREDRKDLLRMFNQNSNTGAFLLAYMDYQLGHAKSLKATLQSWKDFAPHNRWPDILLKAWVDHPVGGGK
ncbi:MAG: tetratricopeptide repeat protein [Phycisphaerales bacterium]|nr:tetratricopeptide repeat protein [Phycisphaerales bacterium]